MATPLISIVIPCYNGGRWLQAALQSVHDQGIDNLEVIVIDDGSTDDSVAIARRDGGVSHVLVQDHAGASRARNVGTAKARGDYIQYLDADDHLAPGKITKQLAALEAAGADVAYGDWQRFKEGHVDDAIPGEVVRREIVGEPEIELFLRFWCPPAAYLFTRRIVNVVGTWNEALPVIQDARFALDCALRGGRFQYVPGVMAYYRVHASGSLSTRDHGAFVRDCLRNAVEVRDWWLRHGGLTDRRRRAIIEALGFIARGSYRVDASLFEEALGLLEEMNPGYVPSAPKRLALASRIFGYRGAEGLAWRYRRAKAALTIGHRVYKPSRP